MNVTRSQTRKPHRVNRSKSKRNFSRTAAATESINSGAYSNRPKRGGGRL